MIIYNSVEEISRFEVTNNHAGQGQEHTCSTIFQNCIGGTTTISLHVYIMDQSECSFS